MAFFRVALQERQWARDAGAGRGQGSAFAPGVEREVFNGRSAGGDDGFDRAEVVFQHRSGVARRAGRRTVWNGDLLFHRDQCATDAVAVQGLAGGHFFFVGADVGGGFAQCAVAVDALDHAQAVGVVAELCGRCAIDDAMGFVEGGVGIDAPALGDDAAVGVVANRRCAGAGQAMGARRVVGQRGVAVVGRECPIGVIAVGTPGGLPAAVEVPLLGAAGQPIEVVEGKVVGDRCRTNLTEAGIASGLRFWGVYLLANFWLSRNFKRRRKRV